MQNLLLFSMPPVLAATIYMSLGRLILALDAREYSLINPRWLTVIFVTIDVVCILTQLTGASLPVTHIANAESLSKNLLMAGLIAQLVALLFFVTVCLKVHLQLSKRPIAIAASNPALRWQKYFMAIEAATVILLVRTIVRTAEFVQGTTGFVASHEVFIYLFDAVLILSVMLLLLAVHPGALVQQLKRDGERVTHGEMTGNWTEAKKGRGSV
jgi:hypothetical protein